MLCDSMDCGGAETHILTLASALSARGHELTVASRGGRLVGELQQAGARHVTLPLRANSPLALLCCRISLCKLLAREKFDIVHAHSRLTSFLAQGVAERRGAGFVVTAHAYFSLSPLRRRLSRWGSSTIAVSEDIRQYLMKNYSLLPNKIRVIPNGVDERKFRPTHAHSTSTLKIAFLSRLDGDCSLTAHLLCDIAPKLSKKHPDLSIVIGGGGNEFDSISKKAVEVNRKLGKEFIKCVGEVKDTAAFLGSADIFIGVSRAAIEAGTCALPMIICGNEGFLGRLAEHNFELAAASNFTARKQAKPDAKLLLNELFALLSQDTDELFEEAKKLRELFLARYSLKSFVESTEDVYKSTPRKKKRASADSILCGYYGYGNIGDDALLEASLRRASREYRGESIAVMTKNGKADGSRFGASCIKRSSPLAVFFAICGAKRLIFGGGTLLQSSTSRRSLVYYCALLMLAGSLKKECILWANGIELADSYFCRMLLRSALKKCSYIGVRDTRSLAVAKNFAPKATVTYEDDLAKSEFYPESEPKRINYLLNTVFLRIPDNFILAAPRARADDGDISLLVKALAAERKNKKEILAVPMNSAEDGAVCMEICRSLGAKMLDGVSFCDLVGLAGHAERIYSMRYHGLVAAEIAGTEAIGIGSDEKISVYCKEKQIKRLGTDQED